MSYATNPSRKSFFSISPNSPTVSRAASSRELLVTLLQAALSVGELRFAQQLSLNWLTVYPGDLPVRLLNAQAWLQAGIKKNMRLPQVISDLENICKIDPEYLEAQQTLQQARISCGLPADSNLNANVLVLGGGSEAKNPSPPWASMLIQARQVLAQSKGTGTADAEQLVHKALVAEPYTPLAGILHLQMAAAIHLPGHSLNSLALMYHERWPECLYFILILADSLMDGGAADQAVELLHQASAQDVTGQVPKRIWGEHHPYRGLWPEQLETSFLTEMAVPAAVAAVLGWNRLPAGVEIAAHPPVPTPGKGATIPDELKAEKGQDLPGQAAPLKPDSIKPRSPEPAEKPVIVLPPAHSAARPAVGHGQNRAASSMKLPAIHLDLPDLSDGLRPVQVELERVAKHLKKPQLAMADGRFPVYIIFTTRQGLERQYGIDGAAQVEEAMRQMAAAVRARGEWNSLVYTADAPYASDSGLSQLNLKPAKANDPWSLKLALTDLDAALRKKGEMIGAVLIVGGPEIVPFHRLPNPVDDDDIDVPSDNPYASRDENYFVPEWPVGRLPAGSGKDPALLIRTLKRYAERHALANRRRSWAALLWRWTIEQALPLITRSRTGLGYTAAIWKRASASVFRPIGEPAFMLISPPVQIPISSNGHGPNNDSDPEPAANRRNGKSEPKNLSLPSARMAYFNLHGTADAAEWYGHRDPFEPEEGPDYPVALRPGDISTLPKNGPSLEVVFSEACFGAHLESRSVEGSIALTFLDSGVQALVGSTCTAYGAVNSPLTAADLLGFSFWTGIKSGLPAGEALRRAKLRMAREMHRRQGYLDGEDQKTIISFVLYGDPLFQPVLSGKRGKSVLRSQKPPAGVKLVCDLAEPTTLSQPLSQEMLLYVKEIVREYLPGMEDAQLALSHEHVGCGHLGHKSPTGQMGTEAEPPHPPQRQVVTLSKQVPKAQLTHKHYARLTLDAKGKLVKLVVSR